MKDWAISAILTVACLPALLLVWPVAVIALATAQSEPDRWWRKAPKGYTAYPVQP